MTPRVKRQPQRTCIACRRAAPKRELVRIVRTPSGEVAIDTNGKLSGRGAYLCATASCWQRALKNRLIDRALKVTLTLEDRDRIAVFGASLGAEADPESI